MNINLCTFYSIGIDFYKCSKCGIIIESPDSVPIWPCSNFGHIQTNNDTSAPNIRKKILNFCMALFKQILTGFRLCSRDQIAKRYQICQECEFFRNGGCSLCGCPIFRDKKLLSKLSWKTSKCPINKW